MKWLVSFNPYTNQFNYGTVQEEIRDNIENLMQFGNKIHESENTWLLVGVADSFEDCAKVVEAVKPLIKKDFSPTEKFIIKTNRVMNGT